MSYETRMDKGRDGWRADTLVPIEGRPGYFLHIRTYKTRGGLTTTAGTEKHEGHSVITRIFRDFHQTVCAAPTRCTEKSVREQHYSALEKVPTLLRMEAEYEEAEAAKEKHVKIAA